MTRKRGELVEILLEVDRAKAALEASIDRADPAPVIREHYDRFIEALTAKKEAFTYEVG